MRPETVAQIINWQGGVSWLKNTGPETLFTFLEKEYRGNAKIIKPATNSPGEGWILFVGKIDVKTIWVIGYFYQKGEWPVCLKGRLKCRLESWYFVSITNLDVSLKLGDFIEKTLAEVNVSNE